MQPSVSKQEASSHVLSQQPFIHESARVTGSTIGGWTSIGAGTRMTESTFGDYSYCMDEVVINYSEIGKFCSIASHACINPVNHPMWRVTQHHMTYRRKAYGFHEEDDALFFDWRRSNRVTIGHDVWIGHGAFVMSRVNVGTGSVIGSGAIVTKDVEPYTVVVGVPAKPIRERFPRDVAAKLLDIAWWDWSREQLEQSFEDFSDLERFLKIYGK